MKIALIQMRSSADLKRNMAAMERATASAAARGARIVAFPEMAYFTGHSKDCPPVVAKYAEIVETFRSWARKHRICLLPGTVREPSPSGKQFNTLLALGPDGQTLAHYRKIFLFKADLIDRKYDESAYTDPGREVCVFEFEQARIGLSICYDVRFPELFRALKKRAADMVFLPAAFTVPTGRAHWETLLRARAIENQMMVLAPGLCGRSGNGAATFGNTLHIDAWGKVRGRVAGKPAILMAQWDAKIAHDCRTRLDAWSSRREDLFPI